VNCEKLQHFEYLVEITYLVNIRSKSKEKDLAIVIVSVLNSDTFLAIDTRTLLR
jgi:hypothetical protein